MPINKDAVNALIRILLSDDFMMKLSKRQKTTHTFSMYAIIPSSTVIMVKKPESVLNINTFWLFNS